MLKSICYALAIILHRIMNVPSMLMNCKASTKHIILLQSQGPTLVKVRFLGVPLEQIDKLIEEEEIVKVSISTYKREVMGHYDGNNNARTTIEEVHTGGWG